MQHSTLSLQVPSLTIINLFLQNSYNPPSIIYIYIYIYNKKTGQKETLESLLNGKNHEQWLQVLSNEIGRLANGNKYSARSANTIKFIKRESVPKDKAITYASFVCDHRPLKTEPWRVCCIVGGDRLP